MITLFFCVNNHIVIFNIIFYIALNSLAQAFVNEWRFLPMLLPKLSIDTGNWSQDM